MRKTLLLGLLAIGFVGSALAATSQLPGPGARKLAPKGATPVREGTFHSYGDTLYGPDGLTIRRSSGSAHITAPGQKTRTCQMFNNTAFCD